MPLATLAARRARFTTARSVRDIVCVVLVLAGAVASAFAQPPRPVPQPFPRPANKAVEPVDQAPPSSTAVAPGTEPAPTAEELGFPVYPNAQFIASYDAGRGQRFYLFGTAASFEEMVTYYKIILDTGGNLVFEAPATHVFEVGRFREETMAFPAGVTIKDYTWNGSEGYLNPQRGANPPRFRTIIQLVPPLSPAASR